MRCASYLLLAALCLLTASCSLEVGGGGPGGGPGSARLSREEIKDNREKIVAEYLCLTSDESKCFWPVYRGYRRDVDCLIDRLVCLNADFANCLRIYVATDPEIQRMLNDLLALKQKRLDVQKCYLPRFKEVLPVKKVARLYQLDDKMDAVVVHDLVGSTAPCR